MNQNARWNSEICVIWVKVSEVLKTHNAFIAMDKQVDTEAEVDRILRNVGA